ncbi:MAG: fluoride efflux transporter CrcB [Anaerolineae bacterium]|nr:fluoride efflux transporter CrcB [Anaerolineae bacterium]
MKQVLLIGAGGFVGAVLRYTISGYVQNHAVHKGFPYGTLAVNLIGCFILGLLSYLGETHDVLSAETRAFVLVGLLGALTTFSTFSNETLMLLSGANFTLGWVNLGAQIVLGLGAVWLGLTTAQWLWR